MGEKILGKGLGVEDGLPAPISGEVGGRKACLCLKSQLPGFGPAGPFGYDSTQK